MSIRITHPSTPANVSPRTRLRRYVPTDFFLLQEWWKSAGLAVDPDAIPVDSTFLALIDGVPAAAVSVYPSTVKAFCHIDGFIANPALKGPQRREATALLIQYAEQYSRQLGFKRLVALSTVTPLIQLYESWGYVPSQRNVTLMVKEL